MHDIICPHCNKAFKVDETGYADILKQVRDADFNEQLHALVPLGTRLAQVHALDDLLLGASAQARHGVVFVEQGDQ